MQKKRQREQRQNNTHSQYTLTFKTRPSPRFFVVALCRYVRLHPSLIPLTEVSLMLQNLLSKRGATLAHASQGAADECLDMNYCVNFLPIYSD